MPARIVTGRLLATLAVLHVAAPASLEAQAARTNGAALVRALTPVVARELRTGLPPSGDERRGTPEWRAWDVRIDSAVAGQRAEREFRTAILRATRARAYVSTDAPRPGSPDTRCDL